MIPPEFVQLGTAGIIALALWGVTQAIRPLIAAFVANQKELAGVNRELLAQLKTSNGVIDRNSEALDRTTTETHEMRLAIAALAEAQTALVKALPETIAGIVRGNEANSARLDAHDAQAREGIARIEAKLVSVEDKLTALKAEVNDGHRANRAEILKKIDVVLAELADMRPTPPPPKVLPPPDKLEGQAA